VADGALDEQSSSPALEPFGEGDHEGHDRQSNQLGHDRGESPTVGADCEHCSQHALPDEELNADTRASDDLKERGESEASTIGRPTQAHRLGGEDGEPTEGRPRRR
jgi:hypothetical protein